MIAGEVAELFDDVRTRARALRHLGERARPALEHGPLVVPLAAVARRRVVVAGRRPWVQLVLPIASGRAVASSLRRRRSRRGRRHEGHPRPVQLAFAWDSEVRGG